MRRHVAPAFLLLFGLGLLAGCGQKGPLFLPSTKPVAPATATSTAGPAAAPVPAAASSIH